MSIFGQVWLWSIAAFLVGTLLTWLMLVRPVQARNRVLERRLRAAMKARPPEPAAEPPARFFQPEEPGRESYPPLDEPDFFAGQPEPESYRPLDEPEFLGGRPEPEPTGRFRRDPEPLQRFRPEPEPATESVKPAWFRDASDAPAEEDRTKPAEPPEREGLGLSSVLEPERELDTELTSVFKLTDEKPVEEKGSEHGTLFDPDGPAPAGLPGTKGPDALPEPPAYAFGGGPAPGSDDESAVETTQVLPRRQPRQAAANDGPAQAAPPSIRPIERREPAQPDEGGRSGSLFEPAVRRGSSAKAGDPVPVRPQPDSAVPSGPFGPGSATPRPGGGRPSDEFAVKASVAALRYCTEDSPQYGRMVAEVWFRTPADAEKVGFRPLA